EVANAMNLRLVGRIQKNVTDVRAFLPFIKSFGSFGAEGGVKRPFHQFVQWNVKRKFSIVSKFLLPGLHLPGLTTAGFCEDQDPWKFEHLRPIESISVASQPKEG